MTAIPPSASAQDQPGDYVGSAACGACHANEWASHSKTRHAHTLTPMTVAALGKKAPPEGMMKGTDFGLGIIDGRFALLRREPGRPWFLDYALGSGKQGMTYVSIGSPRFPAPNVVFEMRRSYIPRKKQWYITPGQEGEEKMPDVVGRTRRGAEARQCILCHAVTTGADDLNPEPRFMGVGCESCHGPGSAHIAAVKAGRTTDLKMEDLSKAGGKRLNALCGACHGTPEFVSTIVESQRLGQRFMPYGLAQSRCFQQSADRLSCSTCHNPHADADTDPKKYEKVCLSCHSPAGTASSSARLASMKRPTNLEAPSTASAGASAEAGKVCPVNSHTGCIRCHMPTRDVFAINGNRIPIAMADHWIRINRESTKATH